MNRFSDTYRFFETYLFSIRIGFFLIRIVFQYVSVFWYVSIDQYVSIFICLYLLDHSESDQLPTKIPIFLLYRIRWYQLQPVFLLYGIGIKNNDIIRSGPIIPIRYDCTDPWSEPVFKTGWVFNPEPARSRHINFFQSRSRVLFFFNPDSRYLIIPFFNKNICSVLLQAQEGGEHWIGRFF